MQELPSGHRVDSSPDASKRRPQTLLELYQSERDALFSYLCGLVREATLAEDILQDVFVSLVKKDIQDPAFNLKSYLYISARNRVIDHFRRSSVHQAVFTVYSAYRDLEAEAAADAAARTDEGDYLRRQLAGLKPEQQEIFYLHLNGGMTFIEIAEVLNLPQGTVASRYLRGIEKLKEQLRGTDYDVYGSY